MKRKLYAVEYIERLEAAAKKPAAIEEAAANFTIVLVDFLEQKGLLDEFEKWVKENHPTLATTIDSL